MKRQIIINAESLETRVAVIENGVMDEFQIEHPTEERIVGGIFKGRIQNLEHDLQAAFVDIGMKKNAFLHYWDMVPDESAVLDREEGSRRNRNRSSGKRGRYSNEEITKRFPPGSEIVVQVTKGPIGTKGPRVSSNLSIPGRYLVMMPGSNLKGVSRKIEDAQERERLRKVLDGLAIPPGMGLIARTVAAKVRKRSLLADWKSLASIWEELGEAIKTKTAPDTLYEEPDLVERVVRDWLTEDVDRIVIDSKAGYDRIREVASKVSRRARSRIHCYEGELPIFDHYEIESQLEEAFGRRVGLKSGGHLVFDETEALIAIDVNTARHKGKGSQEQTILEVNTEAVEEVARQLRLRNIGGLLVVDLIDMKSKRHQNAVYKAMKTALRRDRARTNVLPISPLGLLEMTRQRVDKSISSIMQTDCPYCRGRGNVKSALGMSVEILRQVAAAMRRRRKSDEPLNLQIVVHPTVLDRLRREDERFLLELESRLEGRLNFRSDPTKHLEFFSITDMATEQMLYSSVEK